MPGVGVELPLHRVPTLQAVFAVGSEHEVVPRSRVANLDAEPPGEKSLCRQRLLVGGDEGLLPGGLTGDLTGARPRIGPEVLIESLVEPLTGAEPVHLLG